MNAHQRRKQRRAFRARAFRAGCIELGDAAIKCSRELAKVGESLRKCLTMVELRISTAANARLRT